jgi:Tfp pilus assembly protein PilF
LLDTRALAFLAQGKAEQAVADLKTAVADDPSVTKYFHLALAEKHAGHLEEARAAMAKAEELGAKSSMFTSLEKKNYEQLASELK